MIAVECVECGAELRVSLPVIGEDDYGYAWGMCAECGTFLEIERVDGTVMVSA